MFQERLPVVDLLTCFERASGAQVVLESKTWSVLAVTDRYLELAGGARDTLVGSTVFDLWSGQSESFRADLHALLDGVMNSNQPSVRICASRRPPMCMAKRWR
jgi:hypothetical protein